MPTFMFPFCVRSRATDYPAGRSAALRGGYRLGTLSIAEYLAEQNADLRGGFHRGHMLCRCSVLGRDGRWLSSRRRLDRWAASALPFHEDLGVSGRQLGVPRQRNLGS